MKVAMSHTKSDLLRLAQFSCTSCGGHCAISKSRAKLWTTVMLSWTTKNLCVFFSHLDSTLNLWVRPRLPMGFQCVSRNLPFFRWGYTVISVEALPRLALVNASVLIKKHDRFSPMIGRSNQAWLPDGVVAGSDFVFFCEKAMFFYLGGRGGKCSRTSPCLSFCTFFCCKTFRYLWAWGQGHVRGNTDNTAGFSAPPSNINKNTLRLWTLRKGGGKDG